jgi:mRNA-degrading endonuclease toxin of MazEF toxin-antitoxin module
MQTHRTNREPPHAEAGRRVSGMPAADLPKQFDAFLLELPYPGRPSGGKHVAAVLSTERFHAATGRALVAGLIRPKGDQRYPSHVVVPPGAFTPWGEGRPLPEERVVQLDQARTVPAHLRALRIGALAEGLWDGRACPDGYGLETALWVQFQVEGYLRRRARHGRPMRPVEVPGGRCARGSVWRARGEGGPPVVIVSNETYNEISDFVQGLEIAAQPGGGSVEVLVHGQGAVPGPAGHLLPSLRCVAKAGLEEAGRLDTSHMPKLDACLLGMLW